MWNALTVIAYAIALAKLEEYIGSYLLCVNEIELPSLVNVFPFIEGY